METTKQISKLMPGLATDAYKHIELTPEELAEAIQQAKQKKDGLLKIQAYREKLRKEPEFITYTSGELYKSILDRIALDHSKFVLDDFNTGIVIELCKYFTGDKSCIYKPDKGLLLQGPVGCGKTTLMQMFRFNQVSSYAVISSRTVSYEFSKNGYDGINRYFGLLTTSDIYKSCGQGFVGVCFDDIGTEIDKKHYGNESNVMAEILLNRYDNKALAGKTHLTTNLSIDQIGERYGDRVKSRFKEMFNQVDFAINSPDRRK